MNDTEPNLNELLDRLQTLADSIDHQADSIDHQAKAIMALVAVAADMMDQMQPEEDEPSEYLDGTSCL